MFKQQDTENSVQPRTANLLACRQWWKVCFLHGDQEKYYRQVYGRAAAQRLALAQQSTGGQTTAPLSIQTVIYPTKQLHPVVLNGSPPKTIESRKRHRQSSHLIKEPIIPHSRVTVLDDPFLFGIDNDGCGSDSGIDANPQKASNNPPLPPKEPKPILKTRLPPKPKIISSGSGSVPLSSSPEGSPRNVARSRNGITGLSEILSHASTAEPIGQQCQREKSPNNNNVIG